MKLKKQEISSNQVPNKFYYIWNYLEWGGAQTYFLGLIKEARKYGEVLVILPVGSSKYFLDYLDRLEIPYRFVQSHLDSKPAPNLKRKLQRHWNKIKNEFELVRFVNQFDLKNSILHVEFAPWQSMLALVIFSIKTKVFVTLHTSVLPIPTLRYRLWQLKFKILTRFKNFNIFTGNLNSKESLKSMVSKEFFEKITITYSFINPEEIESALINKVNRIELCRKYNIPPDKFLVFSVGQFINRKGCWIFLEVIEKLLAHNNEIVFVWISNSVPDDDILEKVQSYQLGENFRLMTADEIGSERFDLFNLLKIADVFALPSYVEGLPLALLEAMALRIPCISTNINGIPEAIKHLETGYLIESGKSEALKDAILTLKNDPKLRAKLANCGREFVLANFNQTKMAKMAVNKYFEAFY